MQLPSILRTTVLLFTAWLSATAPVCSQWEAKTAILKTVEKTFGDPPGMVRLDPKDRVWADKKSHRVVVDGYVALRQGQLEMLACLTGTKEHESIVATFCKAQTVHAGLLAIGAKQGTPVKWEPAYIAPTGSEIQVFALWMEGDKKKNINVREWVRVVGSESATLDTNFVFAGSSFWQDPDTGDKIYQAESGDLICVSNFSTSTLDVPIESSKANSGLLFAAFTDRIPPEGTPIRLVLQLVEDKKSADGRSTPSSPQNQAESPAPAASSVPPNDSLSTEETPIDGSPNDAASSPSTPIPSLDSLVAPPQE